MKVSISNDKLFIEVIEANDDEIKFLNFTFIHKDPKYNFKKKYVKTWWDGNISFIWQNRFIPLYLFKYLTKKCKESNITLRVDGELLQMFEKDDLIDNFDEWAYNLVKDIDFGGGIKYIKKDYQFDVAKELLKRKFATAEVATSAGKTLIFYLIVNYMLKYGDVDNILVIVPSVSLVEQFSQDFILYNVTEEDIRIQEIYSGADKKVGKCNLIVGTYQSLVKRDESFFQQFDAVLIDEVDTSKCYSIQKILRQCTNTKYRLGMSGTLPDENRNIIEYLQVISSLGPIAYTLKAADLIESDDVVKPKILQLELDYLSDEKKKEIMEVMRHSDGKERFEKENKILMANKSRINFISKLSSQFGDKNQLILFKNVAYGRALYEHLRQTSNKVIRFIDGSISQSDREKIFNEMKENDGTILVASFGTLSTGVSIRSIQVIIFTQSFKNEKIIRQSIGRGLRKNNNKDDVKIIDIVDFLTIHLKHGKVREEIYKREKFIYTKKQVKI